MQNAFEQIRDEIHAIRNFLGPLDLKLENLDHHINASRTAFETRASQLESRISSNTLQLTDHSDRLSRYSDEIARQSERIRQIELFLKMPQAVEKTAPASAHEDKLNPGVLPPQNPAT